MNAINSDVINVQVELIKVNQELTQEEDMMKYVDPDFFDSQYLLIESLKSKRSALIRQVKKVC